jgi:hypothetical protein
MELMKSLIFQKEDEWLKELYAMKFMKVTDTILLRNVLILCLPVQTTGRSGTSSKAGAAEITADYR